MDENIRLRRPGDAPPPPPPPKCCNDNCNQGRACPIRLARQNSG